MNMKNKFIIPILFLALVACVGWGYTQYQAKKQWEINAHNQYQRAFEELTGHASNMETCLSKTMAANSLPQTIRLMTDSWRESNSCQDNLSQLPLTSLELTRTKMLLAEIGSFCLNSAQDKLLKGEKTSDGDWQTINKFRDQARIMNQHLLNLRQSFFQRHANWMQIDRLGPLGATGLAAAGQDNTVTKAFMMLEDGLRRTPDVHFQGNNLNYVPKPTGLTGKPITAAEAVVIARNIMGPEGRGMAFRNEQMIKGNIPSFLVSMTNARRPELDRRFSISVQGGHVLWILGTRSVGKAVLNYNEGEMKAREFLRRNKYPEVRKVAQERFANIITYSFVTYRNGVLHYPELIKTQVAQDNGEVLGMDATAYLTFFDPKERVGKPHFTPMEIRKQVNPHLKISQIQQAEVLDQMYNKVPCYEVNGMEGTERYKVYYNANTQKEEKIRRVDANGNEIQ